MIKNFSKQTNYSKRRMFADPEGAVTIQRYDDFAYPKLAEFTKTQRGAFWVPDEMSLTKDKIDFAQADEATKFIFTSNLLRQTALDSIQGRAPVQVFTPVASVPELEAWVQWWSALEQIHSESYSHIIRNIYQMPTEQFNAIHETQEIVSMLSGIDKYYEELHLINCRRALGQDVKEYDLVKAIYLALVASYGLEAIRFMVSFSTSLGMVENKIFVGNGNIIQLILADEMLHTVATEWLINTNVKHDPRFKQVAHECKAQVHDMLHDVVAEEKSWAKYQFQRGTALGMNEQIMCNQVDWTAKDRFPRIGVDYKTTVKSAPLPWFNRYTNTNKTQNAQQENEGVAYVLGALTSEVDHASLPEI